MSTFLIVNVAATFVIGLLFVAFVQRISSSVVSKSSTTTSKLLHNLRKWLSTSSSSGDEKCTARTGISTTVVVKPKHKNLIATEDEDSEVMQRFNSLNNRAKNMESRIMNYGGRLDTLETNVIEIQQDIAGLHRDAAISKVMINAQGDRISKGEEERVAIKKELEEHNKCFYISSFTMVALLLYLAANNY